jgi:hypothetical protein
MLRRTISTNISNQRHEGTCFAHSITRVILNAIKQTIPELFYPLEENDRCDEYYDSYNMTNVFKEETTCSENSFNNLIMYIYIYKILTNKFACNGGVSFEVLKWFVDTIIYQKIGEQAFIMNTLKDFEGFNDTHLERIAAISNHFLSEFYTNQTNEFVVEQHDIRKAEEIIKSVIDKGYYILISGSGHVMTIVNYKIRDGVLVLIIKNSYGKTENFLRYGSQTGFSMKDGIIATTIDNAVAVKFTQLSYILPKYSTELDKATIKEINKQNRDELDKIDRELRDREFRRKYTSTKKGGKKSRKPSRRNKKTKRRRLTKF